MKLHSWEIECAARDRDAGKIIEIFASHFPELRQVSDEWVLEVDNTETLPSIIITVVTPSIALTYVRGAFRVVPPPMAKYMRLSNKPYCITLDGA